MAESGLTIVTGEADKNLISKWDQRLKACQTQRQNFERQWHANLAFYFGRQWIAFHATASGTGFSISEPAPSNRWRVRHTSNKVKRVIRNEITKLTKEEPQFYTMPATTEESDRSAALAADSISDYLLHSRYFNLRRSEATFWAVVCGTSFIKTFYNPDKEDFDGKLGKIEFEAVTPFHLFAPYLQLVDIQEQPYVFHARTFDPDTVEGAYGKRIDPTVETTNSIVDSRFMASIGVKESNKMKQCYIKEVWVKPCKDFPKGAMFTYGNETLLTMYEPEKDPASDPANPMNVMQAMQEGTAPDPEAMQMMLEGFEEIGEEKGPEFPYTHNQFPFAKIDHVPTGRFYAQSVIDDLIPIQKEYNRTRSQMIEARNLSGKPQWAMTKGAFDPRMFNSKPGLVLPVNLGFDPPKVLEQPPVSQHHKDDLEIAVRDMDDISGQYEISKGRTPPGVEAASAIAFLQEENDTILYHTVESIESAVQTVGIQALNLVHDFWTEDRIVRIVSRNNSFEAKKFKGSDLRPIMDFRVESQSMAPRSRAAKQAFITELMKMGVLQGPQAMRYLQMNETNRLYDEMQLDARHAQRENAYMAEGSPLVKMDPPPIDPETGQAALDPMTGMPMSAVPRMDIEKDANGLPVPDPQNPTQVKQFMVTTNPFDNHQVHIYEHESYCKTQEWEMLPVATKQVFQDHINEHKQQVVQEQRAIQQEQMQAQPQEEQVEQEPTDVV